MNKKVTNMDKLANGLNDMIMQSSYLAGLLGEIADKLSYKCGPESITMDDYDMLLGLASIGQDYAKRHNQLAVDTDSLIEYKGA